MDINNNFDLLKFRNLLLTESLKEEMMQSPLQEMEVRKTRNLLMILIMKS
jgi:hypothetical protein